VAGLTVGTKETFTRRGKKDLKEEANKLLHRKNFASKTVNMWQGGRRKFVKGAEKESAPWWNGNGKKNRFSEKSQMMGGGFRQDVSDAGGEKPQGVTGGRGKIPAGEKKGREQQTVYVEK